VLSVGQFQVEREYRGDERPGSMVGVMHAAGNGKTRSSAPSLL
jgi:hypothetical protein